MSTAVSASLPHVADVDGARAVLRWLELEGEVRVNVLRAAVVGVLYAVELVNMYGLRLPFLELAPEASVSAEFHTLVTAIVLTWVLMTLAIWTCLQRQLFHPSMKFVVTIVDIVLLTVVLGLGDGPRSPLVLVLPLTVVAAGVRFHLGLVRFATVAAILGYLAVAWQASRTASPFVVPHYYLVITSAALAFAGTLTGQIVRRAALLVDAAHTSDDRMEDDAP